MPRFGMTQIANGRSLDFDLMSVVYLEKIELLDRVIEEERVTSVSLVDNSVS